jgi:hypothetical protein
VTTPTADDAADPEWPERRTYLYRLTERTASGRRRYVNVARVTFELPVWRTVSRPPSLPVTVKWAASVDKQFEEMALAHQLALSAVHLGREITYKRID